MYLTSRGLLRMRGAIFSAIGIATRGPGLSSIFSSIPLDPLCEQIDSKGGHNAITGRLIDMLQSWGRIAGRSGLPQRCNASSVLANMYLRPLDDALRHFGRQSEPIEWLGHS